MRQIYIIIFCFLSLLISSQTNEVDSLRALLAKSTEDSVRLRLNSALSEICEENDIFLYANTAVNLANKLLADPKISPSQKKEIKNFLGGSLNNLGYYEKAKNHSESALSYYQQALAIQTEIDDKIGMATSINNIATFYYTKGDVQKAIDYYTKSLNTYKAINNAEGMALVYYNMADIYENKGDISKGVDYLLKSVKIYEKIGSKDGLARAMSNLGTYNARLGDLDKSLDYFEKSLKIRQQINDKQGIANNYNNIGYIYGQKKDKLKAIDYYNKSLQISIEIDDKLGQVFALNNIGNNLQQEKKPEEALAMYQKALQLSVETKEDRAIASSYYNMGEIYYVKGNKALAASYGEKSLEISKSLGFPEDISKAAGLLRNIYKSQIQFEKAYKMYTLYILMRDSINNTQTREDNMKQQFQYEYDKKATADSIRNIEDKKITQTKLALQTSEIKRQNTLRYTLIAGIILVFAFLLFFYNRFRITNIQKNIIQSQNEITEKQKKELELKNKNITESILVAKEIQYIIFPSETELNKTFKQHFMLFNPCDILSGDFLWLKTIEDKTFLILGDCTGHGVPASLLTVFANEFLNKIIIQNKTTNAAEILSLVNEEIYNYLKRKQQNIKTLNEGMDIGVCVIERSKNNLAFCGARINLFYTTKQNILNSAQGNKIYLGNQLTGPKTFVEHNLPLTDLNTLYLTTDGLTDQLKYRSNKTKYGFKGFESFIVQNNQLTLEEQKDNLQIIFEDITAREGQIDDILVFACKISN